MKPERAIEILEMLLEGVDPVTGERLPQKFLFEQADVILAICAAIQALKESEARRDGRGSGRGAAGDAKRDAGREWTQEEDQRLKTLYRKGVSSETMRSVLHRRTRDIRARLVTLGLKGQRRSGEADEMRPARHGEKWLAEEDAVLRKMFEEGRSLGEMMAAFQRSERGVRFRLERLQLIEDAENYPESGELSTRKDGDDLKRRFLQGETIEQLARRYALSEKAIRARLFYMGLLNDPPNLFPYRKR